MTERVRHLREASFSAKPGISAERALIVTEAYREYEGKVSVPVLRALAFKAICENKSIFIGEGELIVGERGPAPKATPTYPELTCHSLEDLDVLRTRPMTSYEVGEDARVAYRDIVIPFWKGRSMRDIAFANVPDEWKKLYEAGVFTEFMEQRAPGHTALDGKVYELGYAAVKRSILAAKSALSPSDPRFGAKADELDAMAIAVDAASRLALRHALAAEGLAEKAEPERRNELLGIAARCRHLSSEPPRDFAEALQAYWFVHLGTVTELNGWDSMSPGHLDRHLLPFYERDLASGALDREGAKELLSCLWIKFNNTPAPPKVGVTAKESGTYNDFANVNLGGLSRDGRDGANEVTSLALEVLDELRLLQPQANLQVSARTQERYLREACRVIRKGAGYPSLFNADEVTLAQVAMGKSLPDAREGGTSGCVETGCFGKEAYILHGYLNLPKLLELALRDGIDPLSGERVGPATGNPGSWTTFSDALSAFEAQARHAVRVKKAFDDVLARHYALRMPAPFLSVWIDDCILNATDYYSGGARYNTDYLQAVGLGTLADSLAALEALSFSGDRVPIARVLAALDADWEGAEGLAERAKAAPKYGNDDDAADSLAGRALGTLRRIVEGDFSFRGGSCRLNLLSTTCHVYFGTKTGATPDGRRAHSPLSDGASPSHGADSNGPTAVMNSLAKLDQAALGGTLLNMRFNPETLSGEGGIATLAALVRGYFRQGGHHVQFNVVDAETLKDAMANPASHRDLLVRVAGYSDYFVDLDERHQREILARTEMRAIR